MADNPGAGLIETRSIDWVPHDERHGKLWHQLPLWFNGNFQYFSIPIGFIGPSMGLSLGWTAVAVVVGIVIGTLFMAFHASQGPHLGLPQMIQSRGQFGYRGVVIPLAATLFTYVAFNIADQVLLGSGLKATFHWNAQVVAVISAVAAALLAIFGHDWVHRVFRWILAVALPLMTVVTVGVLLGFGGGATHGHPGAFTWVAFMAQLSAAAAYNITYAPYVSDYSRYLPVTTRSSGVIASVFGGASIAAIWLMVLGAWMAIRLGATDGLAGLQTAGDNVVPYLGTIVALLSVLALVATMGMNAYGGALTVLTIIDSFRSFKPSPRSRVIAVLVLAVVWFAVAESISGGAVQTVEVALTLMLYLLVPWTATNLVDFFLVRKGHYAIVEFFKPNGLYGTWAWRGLVAYAVGFAVEIPFMVLQGLGPVNYVGPAARALGGVDIAWLVGLAVTSVVYWLCARSLDLSAEVELEHDEDALLE
ncbi:purine-cytosine permease family protein [Tsukamurella soli]|uniref:Cytosine permease n=1 Tax=Tsukamurella soli TaxID=644556 RepID=A0ABP8K9X2_9ACTN